MTRLLLLSLALAAQTAQVQLIRVDLAADAKGKYPAIVDAPVVCGDRILEENRDYWIEGEKMVVFCPAGKPVWTYSVVVVEVAPRKTVPPAQRRKP